MSKERSFNEADRDFSKVAVPSCKCRFVILSTVDFANRQIAEHPLKQDGKYVPQTNEYLARVAPILYRAFTDAMSPLIGENYTFPEEPPYMRAQRWGAAYVSQAVDSDGEECIFDGNLRFAACGDFFRAERGVTAAIDSGLAAADALRKSL